MLSALLAVAVLPTAIALFRTSLEARRVLDVSFGTTLRTTAAELVDV